ncbi:hypothetical protein M758_10G049000 [Ceratodon purpureus]|uniref:F-box domain-containing protein n=1 Tax=Ceratodon purpureus TaxID=3225 RepID=A0A8T0GIA9_CERPU|nr:hypothetical protein KC19_10G052500 [Ceratodon purpureus]KAG0602884.1 hypothetical protein M758_10G049000 [Ceratodon purpureus]
MASLTDSDADGTSSDYEDDASLCDFLENEVLRDQEPGDVDVEPPHSEPSQARDEDAPVPSQAIPEVGASQVSIQTGNFGRVPPELFQNILRFLSSEDLSTCTSVCRFLRRAASDESLWRKLYCLRWGPPARPDGRKEPRGSAWKKLYFERDHADMAEFVRNTPGEFRDLFIQMQAAKRSQAPSKSQVYDDLVVVDTSIADQITAWRRSQSLADVYTGDHSCSGSTCSYYQIGDVFLCEKTGRAHVCDDTCKETVLDSSNDLLVCTVSGRCFDRWLSPAEENGAEFSQQQADANAAAEEGEPFLGSGRLGRAYLLGYNCVDDRELDEALREVVYPSRKKSKSCHSCSFT